MRIWVWTGWDLNLTCRRVQSIYNNDLEAQGVRITFDTIFRPDYRMVSEITHKNNSWQFNTHFVPCKW